VGVVRLAGSAKNSTNCAIATIDDSGSVNECHRLKLTSPIRDWPVLWVLVPAGTSQIQTGLSIPGSAPPVADRRTPLPLDQPTGLCYPQPGESHHRATGTLSTDAELLPRWKPSFPLYSRPSRSGQIIPVGRSNN